MSLTRGIPTPQQCTDVRLLADLDDFEREIINCESRTQFQTLTADMARATAELVRRLYAKQAASEVLPGVVQRILDYAGKEPIQVDSECFPGRSLIELAGWIVANTTKEQRHE